MLTQHNRKTARLSPDYTFAIRELGVWSGDETNPGCDFLSDAGFLNLENFQPLARFKVRKIAVLAGHAPKS